jgi:dipeptidase E
MLLLTSNGLTAPALRARAASLLSGCRSLALVTTASVGYKEKDWHVPQLSGELRACGLARVDCFDFDCQSASALLAYDAALLIGGNPFYLLSSIRRANAAPVLQTFALHRVLIGVSAGAMVLGPSLALANLYTPEMNAEVGLTDLTGLDLTCAQVLPHYKKFLSRFDRFEERAAEYERQTGARVLRLDDGQAALCHPPANDMEIV